MYICVLFTMTCLEKEKEKQKNRDIKIEGKNDDIKTTWERFI